MEIETGTPEIRYDGDNLTITYDGDDEFGTKASLFFSGVPGKHDLSSWK